MVVQSPAISVPLRTDQHGIIRVGDTRVTLDVIIARHQQGDTPERIHEGFPTVKLADIYSVIGYYLNNQAEVDAYLREQDELGDQLQRKLEAEHPEMFVMQRKLRERFTRRD